jgi:hypothetical protein
VGQTSTLPVAKPLISVVVMNRHPEDALTGRSEVWTDLSIAHRNFRRSNNFIF